MEKIEPPVLQDYDEAQHLAFGTEEEAIAAEAQISADTGFSGDVTARWDVPRQCSDGRWIVSRPPAKQPVDLNVDGSDERSH